MEVKYRTSLGQVAWFYFYLFPRVLPFQILAAAVMIFIGYLTFQSVATTVAPSDPLWVSILVFIELFVLQLLGLLILILVVEALMITTLYRRMHLNADSTLAVSEAGVVHTSSGRRFEVTWAKIPRIIQTRGAILIYTSELGAFVIPKKSFPAEAKAREFFNYASRLWQTSRNAVLAS